ncbi:MAG: DUF1016 family protein [Candidatus Aminicenantes bacterium]|nr:DUF1016 family protein [Candidatus Aminicenantes bacterium]
MAESISRREEEQFKEITHLIKESRDKTLRVVNKELLKLYWEVGEYINKRVEASGWGMGVVRRLAEFIQESGPGLKGFTSRNLWRMKQFYETYKDYSKLSPLWTELSWSNNRLILSKTKTIEEKEFYLRLSVKENYSARELDRQISSGYFERTMLSNRKTSTSVEQFYPSAGNVFKDKYLLEFLDLPDPFTENDLQKSIINNLKKFILEVGRDFSFVAEEFRLQVGMHDYYIDLLFFHRELSCLVAFDLKIEKFKPEYLGKMNFYLEALDRDVKKPHENPSIGILLCKGKDSEVVEYALSRNISPAVIADYETKLIDKRLLQAKLHEFFELAEAKKNE